jgi:hypothetical protein
MKIIKAGYRKGAKDRKRSQSGQMIRFAGLGLFILLQIYLFFFKKHECLDLEVYPNNTPTYFICGQHSIGQTFIAPGNNLCRIDIMMGTYGRKSEEKIFFFLYELRGKKQLLLRQEEFPASQVKNNLYHEIRFRPVSESKKKTFYFFLTSPEATPETAISAWMNNKNIYRHGNYVFDGRPQRGDLVFRTYSQHNLFNSLGRVVRKYPGFMNNKYLFFLAVAFFELISLAMFLLLLELLLDLIQPESKSRLLGAKNNEKSIAPNRSETKEP